ncbi:unnamed protein product [Timema podura]|uniref:C-type lectin domain-containing protein n=1 Tax=Timema podura TaxID=61482 RepID=A0ABN7NSC1_TIMPD|nr:unnamed protein product [Timema podura]
MRTTLTGIDSSVQYDTSRAYLKELDVLENVWIGLKRNKNQDMFTWTDLKLLEYQPTGGYFLEAPPKTQSELCVATDPAHDFRWHSFNCGGMEVASFICELPVPSWAQEEHGCMVTSLPSLTVTFLPEQSAVELTSDCGLDGTRRIACKGQADREEMMHQLSCEGEEESSSTSESSSSPGGGSSIATTRASDEPPTRHRRDTAPSSSLLDRSVPTDLVAGTTKSYDRLDTSTQHQMVVRRYHISVGNEMDKSADGVVGLGEYRKFGRSVVFLGYPESEELKDKEHISSTIRFSVPSTTSTHWSTVVLNTLASSPLDTSNHSEVAIVITPITNNTLILVTPSNDTFTDTHNISDGITLRTTIEGEKTSTLSATTSTSTPHTIMIDNTTETNKTETNQDTFISEETNFKEKLVDDKEEEDKTRNKNTKFKDEEEQSRRRQFLPAPLRGVPDQDTDDSQNWTLVTESPEQTPEQEESLETMEVEPEMPARPNRGRRLTRPQGSSFYPYFLNRVLG